MNSIIAGKNVCIVRDWHTEHSKTVQNVIAALKAAGAVPYLFDDIISGDRRQGFLNNVNKADLFVICSETNLISSYIDKGTMMTILNTIKGTGKYVYELPLSKFLFYQNPQFGGVLISHLVSGSGDINLGIYDALVDIIGDIQAKGGFVAQITQAMENDPNTLPGKLAADVVAKQQQDAVRNAVANARITALVAKVEEYIRKGWFEELAYRGISVQASEGIDSLGGPQELQRQLQVILGDVRVDYDTGFSQDRHNDRPRTHTLKVSGGAVEEGIQRLREARIQHIVDDVLKYIKQVNIGITNSYMVPKDYELDNAAQKLCITKFADLGIQATYDENTGMYGESGSDRPKPHYLRFDKTDIQAKLAEALADTLVAKITASGNFDGPWTFDNQSINGQNGQIPIEVLYAAQVKMGNSTQIEQKRGFYDNNRHLEIKIL